jgi:hypothetical protein
MQINIFNNYTPQNVSDKGKTQATLHSRFARVGEYQLRGSQNRYFALPNFSFGKTTLNNNIKLNKVIHL